MKQRKSQIDSLVDLLIYSFKEGKNLPFEIKTKMGCPQKKKYCKRHHGEIVVTEYKKETNKLHCVYYGIHERKIIYEFDQPDDVLKKMILKYLRVRIPSKNTDDKKYPLMLVRDLKKLVGRMDRPIVHTFRINKKEKEILLSKAKKKGVSVGDYIRLKLFS